MGPADQSSLLSSCSFSACTCVCVRVCARAAPPLSRASPPPCRASHPASSSPTQTEACTRKEYARVYAVRRKIYPASPSYGAREWKLRFRIYRAWPVPLFHGLLLATVPSLLSGREFFTGSYIVLRQPSGGRKTERSEGAPAKGAGGGTARRNPGSGRGMLDQPRGRGEISNLPRDPNRLYFRESISFRLFRFFSNPRPRHREQSFFPSGCSAEREHTKFRRDSLTSRVDHVDKIVCGTDVIPSRGRQIFKLLGPGVAATLSACTGRYVLDRFALRPEGTRNSFSAEGRLFQRLNGYSLSGV